VEAPGVPSFDIKDVNLMFYGDFAIVTQIGIFSAQRKTGSSNNPRRKGSKSGAGTAYISNVFVKPSHSDKYFLTAHIASNFYPEDSKQMLSLLDTYKDPTRTPKKQAQNNFGPSMSGSRIVGLQNIAGLIGAKGMSFARPNQDDDDDEDDEDDEDDDG
jgi:hypothetical protein